MYLSTNKEYIQKYSAVLFKGAVQLKLFSETRINTFEQYCTAVLSKGAAQYE